jgi:class 3 adenylate cyclase
VTSTAPRRSFSATLVVPLFVGLILLAGLLPVTIGGYLGVRSNTAQLLNDNRDAILDSLEEQLRSSLDGLSVQMNLVARHLERQDVDPSNTEAITGFMLGAATSQESLDAIGYVTAEGPVRRWARGAAAVDVVERNRIADVEGIWRVKDETHKASWSPPIISIETGRGLLAYRQPVIRDGTLAGVLVAVISWDAKSQMLMSQSARIIPFVLYGRNNVFIHPNMATVQFADQELPKLDGVNDSFLAQMWQDPRQVALGEGGRSNIHWTWTGQGYEAIVFAYRELRDYGETPWIIGYHQSSLETFRVRWIVGAIFYGSIAMVIMGLLVSWWLTRKAIRPISEIAEAARALERLDFAGVSGHLVEGSRLTEVNDTSHALASAARALERFQTYVPRALVSQVMTMDASATRAANRDVSILFMDLAGYTRYSEGRSAADVGDYLNRIFGCVGPIIEAHGGSIDKYTGDGLMAVWGAPAADAHHAERAWVAAQAIVAALRERVAADIAADPAACRIRLGLHSGRVLAGDIGFAGRLDYTVIGRTVNVAQRAQTALREHMGDAIVALAVTATMARLLSLPSARLSPMPALMDGEGVFRVTD